MAVSSLENVSLDGHESLKEKNQNHILVLDIIILASSLLKPQDLKPQDLTPEFNEHDLLFTFSAKWLTL
jgi:hypothetical protein